MLHNQPAAGDKSVDRAENSPSAQIIPAVEGVNISGRERHWPLLNQEGARHKQVDTDSQRRIADIEGERHGHEYVGLRRGKDLRYEPRTR
jgi:hypothetical protein